MSLEKQLDDVDPNYKRDRHIQRDHAAEAMEQARWRLDSSMRGTQDQTTRTLISTAYDLVRQAEALLEQARLTDPAGEKEKY